MFHIHSLNYLTEQQPLKRPLNNVRMNKRASIEYFYITNDDAVTDN